MSIAEKFATMEYGPAPEDPKEATTWLDRHARSFGHFIDGAWRKPLAGGYFDTSDPATGDKLASIAQGSAADVDAAVKAARAAAPKWQALTPHIRARYLYAIARQVQKHSRLFAVLETMDNGKPIRESRDIDVPLVARHFYHHAGYLRWASMIGHKFDAVIGADGSVRELKDKDWPSDATKSADVPKGETKASKDHLDPTSKQAWLELIFATAPRERAWVNEFHLPIPEKMDFAPDGREAVGAETCARVKFDTHLRRVNIQPEAAPAEPAQN